MNNVSTSVFAPFKEITAEEFKNILFSNEPDGIYQTDINHRVIGVVYNPSRENIVRAFLKTMSA
ncbi:MAG: hypothetical protein M3352_05735 [Bacteroidota bacterium]|nr:hypothetical protein [Bacteroidota bacterium]